MSLKRNLYRKKGGEGEEGKKEREENGEVMTGLILPVV
jgi:hypothetical protein